MAADKNRNEKLGRLEEDKRQKSMESKKRMPNEQHRLKDQENLRK